MAKAVSDDQKVQDGSLNTDDISPSTEQPLNELKSFKSQRQTSDEPAKSAKRRCISTACLACRRRKSKCDGNTPSCAACSSVYGTECIYDPNSDHRRKGVYKKDIDNLKTSNSTLQTLMNAILNYKEYEVPELIRQIRASENLNDVAKAISSKNNAMIDDGEEYDSPVSDDNTMLTGVPKFEMELSGKMGELRLENGSLQFLGGTSNLLFLRSGSIGEDATASAEDSNQYYTKDDALLSWTEVTKDKELVIHLMNMYFTWHYTYFTTLSKKHFYSEFLLGKPALASGQRTRYCSSLLVNAMLALGCHFTSWEASREVHRNSATAGDHFFREAKRLIMLDGEWENPRLTTVQALALMSVREAGCGREAKGWVYSGMSFRMAYDLGLNVDSGSSNRSDVEVDARKVTIWGCFLFDKCWSNYLGRQPQLPLSSIAVGKFEVFPEEDADNWSPYTDDGLVTGHSQPSRTRAIALQISALCEISGDLLGYFYNPTRVEKPMGRQEATKKLGELHTRLDAWRRDLPKEMEPKEGQLPNVLVMHMFFQLLFIHLFRPFLKYKEGHSPLPSNLSPRKYCTHAAAMISKLLRIYKRTYGIRQICNIAVYIAHSACTIHLLNLPDKNAVREIVQGVKYLEEIAESWLCARRTLAILDTVAHRWKITLPDEAVKILQRTKAKFRQYWEGEVVESPKTPGILPLDNVNKYSQYSSAYSMPPRNTYATNGVHTQQQEQQQQPPKPPQQQQSQQQQLHEQPHSNEGLSHLPPITATTQQAAEWNIPPLPHQTGLITPYSSPQQQQHSKQNQNANHPHHQQRQPQQPRYLMPLPVQSRSQQFWPSQQSPQQPQSANPSPRSMAASIAPSQPSPSAFFGGADAPAVESTHWWLEDQASFYDNWYGNLGDAAAAAGGGDALSASGLSPAQVHEIYVGGGGGIGVGMGDGGYSSIASGGSDGYKYDLSGLNNGI